jgi:hypothetical protein
LGGTTSRRRYANFEDRQDVVRRSISPKNMQHPLPESDQAAPAWLKLLLLQ